MEANFIAAECDECGEMIKSKKEEKPCPECSHYLHKGECFKSHYEKYHKY